MKQGETLTLGCGLCNAAFTVHYLDRQPDTEIVCCPFCCEPIAEAEFTAPTVEQQEQAEALNRLQVPE